MAWTHRPPSRRRFSGGGHMSSASSSSNLVAESPVDAAPKKPHPPNNKQHEQDMADIAEKIADKEREMKAKAEKFSADMAVNIARRAELSHEISAAGERVTLAVNNLRNRYDEIEAKEKDLRTVQLKTTYRSESQIDQTIAKLEQQRSNNYLSRVEEDKVIGEINKMRRSKNELKAYFKLKAEKDALYASLKDLQEARASRFQEKQIIENEERIFRQKEEAHAVELRGMEMEVKTLRKQRNRLVKEHELCAKDWEEHLRASRRLKQLEFEQTRGTRSLDAKMQTRSSSEQTSFLSENMQHEPPRDPFAGIRQIVTSLLAYLHQLGKDTGETPSSSLSSETAPSDNLAPPPVRASTPPPAASVHDETQTPGYFLPKKYSDAAVTQKIVGKTKKDKKKTKSIAHDALVVQQFASLNLFPPATMGDIPASLEELKGKKQFYDQQTMASRTSSSASATPKASPSDETSSPFPGPSDDVMSPEEQALMRSRVSRAPSITLSSEDQAAIVLLDNFRNLAVRDPSITENHLAEVNAAGSGCDTPDGCFGYGPGPRSVQEPVSTEGAGDAVAVKFFEERNSQSAASINCGDSVLTGSSPSSEVGSEDRFTSETAENSGDESETTLEARPPLGLSNSHGDRALENSPELIKLKMPLSPNINVGAGGESDHLRPATEIIVDGYPDTPEIDEALTKRPNFAVVTEQKSDIAN